MKCHREISVSMLVKWADCSRTKLAQIFTIQLRKWGRVLKGAGMGKVCSWGWGNVLVTSKWLTVPGSRWWARKGCQEGKKSSSVLELESSGAEGGWAEHQDCSQNVGGFFMWIPAVVHCFLKSRWVGRALSTIQHLYTPTRNICILLDVFIYTHHFCFIFLLLKIHYVSQFCFLI